MLPVGDGDAEAVPLLLLALDVLLEDVRPQGLQGDGAGLEFLHGLVQVGGQAGDAGLLFLGRGHLEDVGVDRIRHRQVVLDAVQAGAQHHGKGQVGVAGRVRAADLGARAHAAGGRDAHQGRAVGGRPGHVHRGLVAGYQPLVGVDQRVGDRAEPLGVLHDAGNVLVGHRAQFQRPLLVVEGVGAVQVEQGLVGVHARAVDAEHRLGHEGGVQAELGGDGAHHPLEGDGVVGGGEGVGVLEVDLVLALGHLVVAGLDLEAHGLQRLDDLAAAVDAGVVRFHVEVAGDIVGDGGRPALGIPAEQEELGLGADVHGVAQLLRLGQHPLEVVARAADEGRAVGLVHVADDAGRVGAVLLAPGHDHEGVVVRLEVHVGFVDAHEALDGAAVEHDLAVQGLLDLAQRQGDILQETEDIDKLQAEEIDVLLFDDVHDFVAGHGPSPSLFKVVWCIRPGRIRIVLCCRRSHAATSASSPMRRSRADCRAAMASGSVSCPPVAVRT